MKPDRILTLTFLALATAARADPAPSPSSPPGADPTQQTATTTAPTQAPPAPEPWASDPSRTRYFYAPSALMLHRGEVLFAQRELLFSDVSAGITDNISVAAGAAIPAWFVSSGFNVEGGVKVGFSPQDWLHLAAGGEILVIPTVGSLGFLFGTSTFGDANRQLTVSAGAPFAISQSSHELGDLIVVISGSYRLTEHFGLMTENWLFPTGASSSFNGDLPMINAGGVRFLGKDLSADVGLMRVAGVSFPLPWVNFAYRWSSLW